MHQGRSIVGSAKFASTGLGEHGKQSLREGLEEEAASMAGELMLGHLFEAAKSLLTDLNQPEGDCAICLEPLRSSAGNGTVQSVQKLPCYHCLHRQAIESPTCLYFALFLHLHPTYIPAKLFLSFLSIACLTVELPCEE